MLGRAYVRATYRWQVGNRRSYVLLSETGDQATGLVSVCDGPYLRRMFMACLPQLAWSLVRHPALLLNGMLWGRLLRHPRGTSADAESSGTAHLISVAVHPDWRGRGIFVDLVSAAARRSAARGTRAIRTGVYRSNAASRRAFGKAGWDEVPALETPDTVCVMTRLDTPV